MEKAQVPATTVPGSTGTDVRIEDLGKFVRLASRLSGEMRQPLSVVRNVVYFLNTHLGTDLDEKARRHLSLLLRAVTDMDGIVSNLTTLAGIDVPERQTADVQILVAAALERVQIRPGVIIETVVTPDATIYCDPSQMRLALTNIVNNSIQVLPGEGRIRVECQHSGRETRIVISDNGPGMPKEVLTKVFEPLFTTSSHRVGIGLTAAQRLVGASGGTIKVESTPGAGTTVTLSFPRHEEP